LKYKLVWNRHDKEGLTWWSAGGLGHSFSIQNGEPPKQYSLFERKGDAPERHVADYSTLEQAQNRAHRLAVTS
jgi:hypothetical protein